MLDIKQARELLKNATTLEEVEKAYSRVFVDVHDNIETISVRLNKREIITLITSFTLTSYDLDKGYFKSFFDKVEYQTDNGRMYTICGMSDRLKLNKTRLENEYSIDELADFYNVLKEFKKII